MKATHRRLGWTFLAGLALFAAWTVLRQRSGSAAPREAALSDQARPGSDPRRGRPPLSPAPGAPAFAQRTPPLRARFDTNAWAVARASSIAPVPDAGMRPGTPPPILLAGARLDLPAGAKADVAGAGEATSRRTHPYIVQMDAPTALAERKRRLESLGIRVHGYLPHNAWLVECDDAARIRMETEEFVRGTVAYGPAMRVQPWLGHAAALFGDDTSVAVSIQTLLPEDAAPIADRLRARRATVSAVVATPGRRSGRIVAEVPLADVAVIAGWGGVQWIEEHIRPALLNDRATGASHANIAPMRAPWGLDGAGQVVGHADTGIDTGDPATLHRDVRGRVTGAGWGRLGDWSDPDGHGTHTAGTIIGDGTQSGGQYAGAAPGAQLFHQSVSDATGDLTGLYDLYALFAQSYGAGARIHSDSWGSDSAGAYTYDSVALDEFAWDHPEFLAVFAAGNAGMDNDANGVVNAGSVGAPATAKNVLAVGASESDREPSTGGLSGYTYGMGWPSRFPANPVYGDWITWSATAGPPYLQGMAAFSSRGPAADGRVKPEVVAPGCDVVSLRTSVGLWPEYDWPHEAYPDDYAYNVGTSMATPVVAGGAAVLRQELARRGHPAPTAAMLRAMIAGGARSLSPGQYGTGAAREVPSTLPNSVEGHGQLDVAGTLFPEDGQMARLHDRVPVSDASPFELPVTVVVSGSALRVVLAWSDPPATAGAGIALVNDLNLTVRTPAGAVVKPATAGSTTDTRNTLERIDVAAAVAGVYTVRVDVASLPDPDPERFVAAVYVRGALDEPPVLRHAPGDGFVPAGGGPLDVAVSAHYHRAFAGGEATVRYVHSASATPPLPTDAWTSAPLAAGDVVPGGWSYAAALPPPPTGQYLHYAFAVDTGTQSAFCPTSGAFTVRGYDAVTWTVAGYPGEWGSAAPDYGVHDAVPGEPITATASPTYATGEGQRVRCLAHFGEGGIPFGLGSEVTFTLDSTAVGARLTWLWQAENALTQGSEPKGAIDRVDWFAAGGSGNTASAPEVAWDGGEVPYALTGWWVDDARWPAATGASPNPATAIPMVAPKTAEARYAPFWDDVDADGLRDAWEERWTGDTSSELAPGDDPDGDLWTNFGEDLDNTDPYDAASQPMPPTISDVTVFANPVTNAPPYAVEATVTDGFVVAAVDLLWREAGTEAWTAVPMEALTNDRFRATFEPGFFGTTTSEYCVVACDLLGWYFPEFGTTSPVQRVWSVLPTPRLLFDPPSPWRIEGEKAVLTEDVAIANYGSVPLDYQVHLLGPALGFEQETTVEMNAWRRWSSSTTALWQRVFRRATRGNYSWYCGNASTWQYANSLLANLDTPSFRVATNAVLVFDYWMKAEPDVGDAYWDGGIVLGSTNGGTAWDLLTPVGGYPHRIVPNPASPFRDNQPCFGGRGEGWHTVQIDLGALAGQELIVSFQFGADAYVTDEGWYIDNVHVLDPDHPVPGLTLSGGTQGVLGFAQRDTFTLRFDPWALAPGAQSTDALLLARHNDPFVGPLHPVSARYGHAVTAASTGPGTLSFDYALLFQGQSTTLVATSSTYADVRSVRTNGAPRATSPGATVHSIPFADLAGNVAVDVAFDWTLAEEGVPLWWLGSHGLTGDTAVAVYADSDGDGTPNWAEYGANTLPDDAGSLVCIDGLERDGDGWSLRWRGGPGRTAVVERATALGTPVWHPDAVVLPTDATDYATTVSNGPPAFFRVRVRPPSDNAPP